MIHKSDKYLVQWVNIGRVNKDKQTIRRETWWLFWFIPIFTRDTVL